MAGEWIETTLGHVANFLSGGRLSKDRAEYWGGSIPWVSAKDMKRFRLEDTEDHITNDGTNNGTKVVPAGTIFLLARGMTLLNDVPICVAGQAMVFNQDVKALCSKSGVWNEFLPYLLLGRKERLLSSVDLAGHDTGRLNSDELRRLDVLLPPELEQRAIAHILGTLDDKIEMNRRMSATLEAMARALFKSWFVDFEPVRAKLQGRDPGLPPHLAALFRDRLVETELGEIP
jgi:type I restriction enzyme S subunit